LGRKRRVTIISERGKRKKKKQAAGGRSTHHMRACRRETGGDREDHLSRAMAACIYKEKKNARGEKDRSTDVRVVGQSRCKRGSV